MAQATIQNRNAYRRGYRDQQAGKPISSSRCGAYYRQGYADAKRGIPASW